MACGMVLKRTGALLLLLLMLFGTAAAEETKTVTYRGITVSTDTEYVDLEKRGVTDWDGFYAFLKQLPNLKKVDMFNTVINLKVYNKLNELFPDVQFGVQFRYGRHRVRTDDTAFSTLYSGGDRQHSYDEIAMLTWCTNLYALDIGHHPVKKLDFLYEMLQSILSPHFQENNRAVLGMFDFILRSVYIPLAGWNTAVTLNPVIRTVTIDIKQMFIPLAGCIIRVK